MKPSYEYIECGICNGYHKFGYESGCENGQAEMFVREDIDPNAVIYTLEEQVAVHAFDEAVQTVEPDILEEDVPPEKPSTVVETILETDTPAIIPLVLPNYQWCNLDYRDGGDKRIALVVCVKRQCGWANPVTGLCTRIDPKETQKAEALEIIAKRMKAKRNIEEA